jgi:hypothetical protein
MVDRERYTVGALDLARCGNPSAGDPTACNPRLPPPGTSFADAAVDGDGGVALDAGAPEMEPGDISGDPDAPVLPPCAAGPEAVRPVAATLGCENFVSVDAPEPRQQREQLAQAEWLDANLRIESSEPRVIVIEKATIENAWIELRGPVTLRIDASKRPPGAPFDTIKGLKVSGVATAAGTPRFELDGQKIESIAIGDDARPFEGTVSLRSSDLRKVGLLAHELELESTRIEDGRIHVQRLTAGDAFLVDLEIESEYAALSASVLRDCAVTRCGELALLATRLRSTHLAACTTARARFYRTSYTEGSIDGAIESDTSQFAGVVFGGGGDTDLFLSGGGVARSSLCAGVSRVIVKGALVLSCSMCEVENFADAVCTLPDGTIEGKGNVCVGFDPEHEPPPICELPWPELHSIAEAL